MCEILFVKSKKIILEDEKSVQNCFRVFATVFSTGWIYGDARPVHEMRRGFHDLLLCNGQAQFSGGTGVQKIDIARTRQRGYTAGARGQQIRSSTAP